GYSMEEYMGMHYKEYTTPENAEKLFKTYNQVYRTGKPAELADYELLTKDGRSLAFEASVTLKKDSSGKPVGFRALSRNITEKKHSEEALKLSLQTSEDIVKAIPSGLFIYKFEKPDKLFLIHGNPEAEKITGLKLKDSIGKEFNDIFPEARKNGITESFLSPMKTDTMYETEELYYKDLRIEGAFRIRAFKMPGSRLGVAFENITEKKRLEAQFRQAQKMEAIGTLAGGIAHDFNNLLMGILGRNSLMMIDIDPSHPYFEHLNEVETYVKSAVDLTNQLLGFARGGKYEVVPTNINELIIQHNRMFGRTKKEINIKEKYEEKVWSVEVDRGQIEQVLMNIYVNAWQAMLDGGDLFISTENMTIDQDYAKPFELSLGKYVKISITDTGIGMNSKVKERIFDPFFTTKEKQRGTGMGLSSAYGIIKNHRGFITVYSEPGEGTTFNIYIPASKKKVKKEKKIEIKIVKGSGTILLIDDEQMIVNVGEKILKKLGYDVFTAIEGKLALDIYQKNKDKIDMVILDLIMPIMSGKDIFEALVKINPEIKVLLASGYSLNGKAKQIIDQGCNGFIQKPFNMEQLSIKINEILKQ
ncbi:MAG: response regulator, partial [Desulfobacterales bacterium]|nr:response regulator [Desulfobacterales bacterium]